MKKVFLALMVCALALTSCGKDNPTTGGGASGSGSSSSSGSGQSQGPAVGATSTSLAASITFDAIDCFDFSFTFGGRPLNMKKSVDGNTVSFSYSDDILHANEEVKCTVTVSSKADVESIPETFVVKAEHKYQSGRRGNKGYDALYASGVKTSFKGTYEKLVKNGKVTDKASYAAYLAERFAGLLSGKLTSAKEE